METLSNIQCFVRSAEAGSFAEAARRLGLTPAGVGKTLPAWKATSACACSSAAPGA